MLVITSSVKHSPDLIAFPVSKKKRCLWNTSSIMSYEIQTSASKGAIERNGTKTGMEIKWVVSDQIVQVWLNGIMLFVINSVSKFLCEVF